MAIDINLLEKEYFYFDKPVKYTINDNNNVLIYPVSVLNSEIFMSCIDVLQIDKNTASDINIIQMSYLQFITDVLFNIDEVFKKKFGSILIICLRMKEPFIFYNKDKKPFIYDKEQNITIDSRHFDDIKRIIMYQNILGYDDNYIDPDLKKAMAETDALKNKDRNVPNLERKMAIITAHTGISKKEQMEMTYRSHSLLFKEVCGEVEFTTTRPIALLGAKNSDLDHWIFKKKTGKFDDYITDLDKHIENIGGNGKMVSNVTDSSKSNVYENMFNNFKGGK